MRILITGATGYVGRNLIEKLSLTDNILYGVVRTIDDSLNVCEQILVDEELESNIEKANPEAVIHLAAYLTSAHEWEDVKN